MGSLPRSPVHHNTTVIVNTALELRALLDEVRDGRTDPVEAHRRIVAALRDQPFADLGFAKVDHHRSIRQGFPEVVLGLGKTPDQIAKIASQIVSRGQPLLVTRADEAAWNTVKTVIASAEDHAVGRRRTVREHAPPGKGTIALCSAGTSDLPVAEEAAVTAEILGNTVERMYDVGVAGIHRVLSQRDKLASARVVIVV